MVEPRERLTPQDPGYFPFTKPANQSAETRMLGFDTTAWFSFQGRNPAIQIPPAMVIFQVPKNISRAEVHLLGVAGEPAGCWLNNISWSIRISNAGPQEDFYSSSISGVAATVANSGLRWALVGSLSRPASVRILLSQEQTLNLVITSYRQGANLQTFTVVARAAGVMYA